MKKEVIQENGIYEITTLWNGQLVLAEVIGGRATEHEIYDGLKENGIIFGVIEENIKALMNGFEGQIPVARAHVFNQVGSLWFHFESAFNDKVFLKWLDQDKIDVPDLSYPVSSDERLVTLSAAPKQVLKYPNGRVSVLQELGMDSINFYAGLNTVQGMHQQSLVSQIEGCAHRNIYGIVSVHRKKVMKKVGKMHGHLTISNALSVEEDIQRESVLEVASNLIIKGMVQSSTIHASGNLQCDLGIEGNGDYDLSHIHCGQTLISASLRRYRVWNGLHLIVKAHISESDVESMNTIYAGSISDSQIRVGNKLYVKGDIHGSVIHIGYNFVNDPDLSYQKNLFSQKRKRIVGLLSEIENQKEDLEKRRRHAIEHIDKLRKNAGDGFSSDGLLNMQYRTLETGSVQLQRRLDNFGTELEAYRKLNMAMSVDENNPYERYDPEIVVKGEIGPDVQIFSASGRLQTRVSLKNVSIKVDKLSGEFEVRPLEPVSI